MQLCLERADQQVLGEPLHRGRDVHDTADEPRPVVSLPRFDDAGRPQEAGVPCRPAAADVLDRPLRFVGIGGQELDAVTAVALRAPAVMICEFGT